MFITQYDYVKNKRRTKNLDINMDHNGFPEIKHLEFLPGLFLKRGSIHQIAGPSRFIFALIIGSIFFKEWPDLTALIGICIVTASGGFLLYKNYEI